VSGLVPGETVAELEAAIDVKTRAVGELAKAKAPKEEKMAAIAAVKVLKERLALLKDATVAGLAPAAAAEAYTPAKARTALRDYSRNEVKL
jgi:hypothetical protein